MPIDNSTWKARIGMFSRFHPPFFHRPLCNHSRLNPEIPLLKFYILLEKLSNSSLNAIVFPTLLSIILLHIFLVFGCFIKNKLSGYIRRRFTPRGSWAPSLHSAILFAFLSLVTRTLLIHTNPGPHGARLLNFAT